MAERRRVLVTGGTSGIGRAVVERLAGAGDRVIFSGRDRVRGDAIAAETGTTFVAGDIRQPGTISDIVYKAGQTLGGLDGMVLAAGVLHTARLSETSDADWDAVLETNLIAPSLFAKVALPTLADSRGAIVAIASGTALLPETDLAAYSISKRALLWMTKMLAVECGPLGVRVNAICPGDMTEGMNSRLGERAPDRPFIPPLGRNAAASDIAAAVDFFLGADAAVCTGASLLVDGGLRAALRAGQAPS